MRKNFKIKNRNSVSNIKKYFIFSIIFIFLISFIYLLFLSPLFKINNITIKYLNNKKYLDIVNIDKYVNKYKGQNLFIVNVDSQSIKDRYNIIKNITIDKHIFSSIDIVIEEYPPAVLFQNSKQTFVFSENGVLIDTISNNSNRYKNLPLVVTIESNYHNLPVSDIFNIINKLESDKKIFLSNLRFDSPYQLTAMFDDGHKVIFSTNSSADNQINDMNNILKNIPINKCFIMDVRFKNVYCTPKS